MSLSILAFIAAFVVLFVILAAIQNRRYRCRMRALATERGGESICQFARSLPFRQLDTAVIRHGYLSAHRSRRNFVMPKFEFSTGSLWSRRSVECGEIQCVSCISPSALWLSGEDECAERYVVADGKRFGTGGSVV
jgi:hypothetical protein